MTLSNLDNAKPPITQNNSPEAIGGMKLHLGYTVELDLPNSVCHPTGLMVLQSPSLVKVAVPFLWSKKCGSVASQQHVYRLQATGLLRVIRVLHHQFGTSRGVLPSSQIYRMLHFSCVVLGRNSEKVRRTSKSSNSAVKMKTHIHRFCKFR